MDERDVDRRRIETQHMREELSLEWTDWKAINKGGAIHWLIEITLTREWMGIELEGKEGQKSNGKKAHSLHNADEFDEWFQPPPEKKSHVVPLRITC